MSSSPLERGAREQFADVCAPLAAELACRIRARQTPSVIGIAGAQGSGKSTLASLLARQLQDGFDLRVAVLSLDDLYFTRDERVQLARDVHPLLRTRGVPGTHDVALGMRTLDALLGAGAGQLVHYPRFDKAHDDRMPQAQWPSVVGPIDVLLFEGWCVGALPEDASTLATPINALEREHDADGRWRAYANAQLAGPYRELFARLNACVFLAVPDLASSLAWRREQEAKLEQRVAPDAPGLMQAAELERFAQHFERISRHMLTQAPAHADIVLRLAADHRCDAIEVREPCATREH